MLLLCCLACRFESQGSQFFRKMTALGELCCVALPSLSKHLRLASICVHACTHLYCVEITARVGDHEAEM